VLIGGGRTTTNTTTGDVIDDFSGGDATVASNEFVWITTTSADYAGIVTALHLIIEYRIGS